MVNVPFSSVNGPSTIFGVVSRATATSGIGFPPVSRTVRLRIDTRPYATSDKILSASSTVRSEVFPQMACSVSSVSSVALFSGVPGCVGLSAISILA